MTLSHLTVQASPTGGRTFPERALCGDISAFWLKKMPFPFLYLSKWTLNVSHIHLESFLDPSRQNFNYTATTCTKLSILHVALESFEPWPKLDFWMDLRGHQVYITSYINYTSLLPSLCFSFLVFKVRAGWDDACWVLRVGLCTKSTDVTCTKYEPFFLILTPPPLCTLVHLQVRGPHCTFRCSLEAMPVSAWKGYIYFSWTEYNIATKNFSSVTD